MAKVKFTYKPINAKETCEEYKISKAQLASCYFRIKDPKSSVSHVLAQLGKALLVYSSLNYDHGQLVKSTVYGTTDFTEKLIFSYLLGMSACKWVSEEIFDIPNLQYFSLTKKSDPLFNNNVSGTKCPDLLGEHNGNYWLFEAKGTGGSFDPKQIATGKGQLQNIAICGKTPTGIVTESYFDNDIFSIYAEDPRPTMMKNIKYDPATVIENYYKNVMSLLNYRKREIDGRYVFTDCLEPYHRPYRTQYRTPVNRHVYEIQIGLDKRIFDAYVEKDYSKILNTINEYTESTIDEDEFISRDGISFKIIE